MEFDSIMIGAGNSKCEYDRYVHFKKEKDPTYLLWSVDHMLIVARSKAQVQKGKAQLVRDFDMKVLGEARNISGNGDHSRQEHHRSLAILGELCSYSIGEIQHG